jgi:two-component system, NtrC family, response regulator AtoC
MDIFLNYSWPGNVRELENMIKRIVVLGNEKAVLQEFQVREDARGPSGDFVIHEIESLTENGGGNYSLKEIGKRASRIAEKRVIERVLQQTRWNRKETAEILQISYKALLYKMKENGLSEMT